MVLTLLSIIVIIVMIAMFVGKNLAYSTPIWLFKTFDETNVVVIVFLAFAAGMVFAVLCILLAKIMQAAKSSEEEKKEVPEKEISEKKVSEKKEFFAKKDKKSLKTGADNE